VLNRAVGHAGIFRKPRGYGAFEEVIAEAKDRLPMRVLGWCVMASHWHFVLWAAPLMSLPRALSQPILSERP